MFIDRLTTAARTLEERLHKAKYGQHKLPVSGDISKLRLCDELTQTERQLLTHLRATCASLAGSREIRSRMQRKITAGHFQFGHPIFITISPNEKHSSLTLRLHRRRRDDPLVDLSEAHLASRKVISADWPFIWSSDRTRFSMEDPGETEEMDLPGYDFRRRVASLNPLAPVLSFHAAVRLLLGKLLGLRICAECPRCSVDTEQPLR